ncbi:TPA: DUF551 domain-containing protein [Klebsiella quasipneumoniae]|uniref:DUF551 domain-containing protein n=1 Tax=Klebsiella TaxID=570 RepID=UPI00065065F4|nr:MULTISPECIES: DUF551 domain-containing protein [Klebsiella]KMI92604.1 hypothetical protein SN00_01307 [Klebsiella pneumoniae]MBM0922284.1 DUF551 domain-containing protein [Klebsiella quasipneumoniae]MBW7052981.1 DUF551 domain-containing protein [Klebsiella pneumoniae]MCQ0489085.1 DUF551 domain-containing protein [Klebsiella pneumoniae]MCQ0494396.1 DUF551 domain-containing protein [Klebsiella pneumoniae]
MTSELTRERLQEIAEDGFLKHGEGKELARIALAAMDSEPVVFTDERNLHHIAMGRETSLIWGKQNQEAGDIAIYRHAQPAPALPDFDDVLESLDYEVRCNAWESEHVLKACQATYDACRAAMLQELQKSAGAEATCRSNENVQVLHTKSPAQSDCCPAQNHVSPEQNGDTPAQSQGWIPVSERMPESNGVYFGWDGKRVLEVNCFFGGFSANQFIHGEITHWMPLPAAPQEVKGE